MDDKLILCSNVKQDNATKSASDNFDYQFDGKVETIVNIPNFPKDYQIGLIVGSSGSGKTSLLRKCFGYNAESKVEWDASKAIISQFANYEDGCERLGAVGLNSIPSWLKPYNVLSTGEKFRADMARLLKDGATIDEFTSVVNRETAISCSNSLSKYIKAKGLRNITFASCHKDIIPYLDPDWVYDVDKNKFYTGRYLRPKLEIKFKQCDVSEWDLFKKHHYLSGEINNACICFEGYLNNEPVCFISALTLPGRDVKHAWREHRLVVLPDYQGLGIGNKVSELLGQAFREKGCRYFGKTSNPRIGEHRDRSPLWRATANNHKAREAYLDENGEIRESTWNKRYGMKQELVKMHAHRVCYSHEYVGDGKEYPYSYNEITGQISLDDLLKVKDGE